MPCRKDSKSILGLLLPLLPRSSYVKGSLMNASENIGPISCGESMTESCGE